MNTTSEMQLVQIDKLIPYVNNARTHSAEQLNKLRSSLREFGFINPVIIDRDFNVIAGHGRILAAKAEGITDVPCVFVDYLTPAQKKAYIIADNRMALDAGWDEEMLKVEIEALQADDFDLSLTGFDEKELAAFFDEDSDAKDDDFDVDAEMEKPCMTKPGDLWLLGNHRLVCGDSTKPETYELLMNGKLANLVVTDPPYNVNYEGSAGKIKNDNLENEKFYQFLFDAFTCMEKAMRTMQASMFSTQIQRDLISEKRLLMRGYTFPALVSGRSSRLFSGARRINGSMNRACSVGRKTANTNGTPIASRQQYGSSTSRKRTATTRQ